VSPVESSEPSYVAATIFQDQASFEKWSKNDARTEVDCEAKREKVYYEGTLVINSGE
jgi:heme-degrading monooxygenase HmoA